MSRAPKRGAAKGETIGDYEVGKGKPPKHTRWVEGCASPNPKGRPPKPKPGQRKLDHYLDQIVEMPGPDGKIERMTKRELAYLQIANRAAKGDLAAFRLIQSHDAAKGGGDKDPLLFDPDLTDRLLEGVQFRDVADQRKASRKRKRPGPSGRKRAKRP